MKTNRVLITILTTLCALILIPGHIVAQDKKEKKKKEFSWNWDGKKSGNKEVDDYLMACDTLWNKIQSYKEDITAYNYVEDTLNIKGKLYLIVSMEDANQNKLTTSMANWQLVHSILNGASIVLNGTQIGLQTVSATASLPELGFGALSYAKYVTAGPKIIAMAGKEIKDIVNLRKSQMKKWKSLKENAVDASTIGLDLDEKMLKKFSKSYYIKEILPEDNQYEEISAIYKDKTEEEMLAQEQAFIQRETMKEILPEDQEKMKDLNIDEMGDEYLKS